MPRRVSNPPNHWEATHPEWLGEPPEAELEVFEEEARSILAENESPDVGFCWSLNPYRGCFHACAYTLTRRCLEVCAEFRNPIGIITKGALVRRDVELLAKMARETEVWVSLSIPFADDRIGRAIEPNASLPSQRFETLEILSSAGISTGIGISPLIPGLNDSDIPRLLERAHRAGSRSAFLTLLRLPGETLPVFQERMTEALPEKAKRVFGAITEVRGGKWNESEFGARMRGVGPRWEAIRGLFDAQCRRLGFNQDASPDRPSPFRRPSAQGELFG